MAKRDRQNRIASFRRGHFAEIWAALWLTMKGYRIVARRFKTPVGEIDLIAKKRDLAIFVEVKARRDSQIGVDAVTYQAQNRIRAASDIWLSRQKNYHILSQRYDIIVISPWQLPHHFIDAF